MTDLSIPDELAEQLRGIAQRENRSVTDVLQTMVRRYPAPAPQAAPNIEDEAKRQAAAVRKVRLKTYARARRYWEKVGDKERLALTDVDLDEQFWLIDPDGIPRLKSEQGTIEIPPDPLLMMAEAADRLGLYADRDDISENFDELLRESWPDHLKRKWERNAE